MNNYSINGYTRISKATARKLWNEGKPFWMVACNLRPGGEFGILMTNRKKGTGKLLNFDTIYNFYCYYGCVNNETGRYPAFYTNP